MASMHAVNALALCAVPCDAAAGRAPAAARAAPVARPVQRAARLSALRLGTESLSARSHRRTRARHVAFAGAEQEGKEAGNEKKEAAADSSEDGDEAADSEEIATPLQRLATYGEEGIDAETLSQLLPDLMAQLNAAEERAQAAMAQVAENDNAGKQSKEALLRLNADFQNFRNRTEREKGEIEDRVKGQVLEELIPLIDNFEAAKQYIKPESDGEKKIESSYQGLYKQMVDLFKKMGIEAVPTVGKPFDPAVHEAIARIPGDVTEDTVAQEFRKGFRISGRLIRPAMVSVTVPGGEAGPVVVVPVAEGEVEAEAGAEAAAEEQAPAAEGEGEKK